jgi:formylglycine-generating enzyme required for sulfatase activity
LVAVIALSIWFFWAFRTLGSDDNKAAGTNGASSVTEVVFGGLNATSEATATLTPMATATRPPTPTPETQAGDIRTVVRGDVEVEQVFVPAGSFMMGSEDGSSDEQPVHEVTLDAFWIDRTEVTNAQFGLFVADTGYYTTAERRGGSTIFSYSGWNVTEGAAWDHPQGPASNLDGLGQHPVVQVSWDDATAFCEWAGGRLPTEAEWEYAARGPDNLVYPWGNAFDGTRLNYCDQNCLFDWTDQSVDDGYEFTAPVGSYSNGASWIGALDMAGNIWEWVQDRYGEYGSSPQTNPQGLSVGESRVLRGGAYHGNGSAGRTSNRIHYQQGVTDYAVGFRCAQE